MFKSFEKDKAKTKRATKVSPQTSLSLFKFEENKIDMLYKKSIYTCLIYMNFIVNYNAKVTFLKI